jgi:anti-anti-sigma factor
MDFEVAELSPTCRQVALTGRLDTDGVDRIEARLTATLLSGGDWVIVLEGVTFLASLGIRMLITLAKLLQRRGHRLVLVAPRPLVDQALRHSSIDEVIPVAADIDSALAVLRA